MMKTITRNILLILVAGLFSLQATSQMKQRAADKHYNILAFQKAAEMYSELATGKKATDYQIRRAAECYRFVGDSKNSEKYYQMLVARPGASPEDFYHYAQMLKMNEKYNEANKAMSMFGSKASSNIVAKNHTSSPGYETKLKSIPDKYKIAIFDVNTKVSDFGPNYYTKNGETNIIFASARTQNTSAQNFRFQWDGSIFLDAYSAQTGGDGESVNVKKFADDDIKSRYHEGPISFSNNGSVMYLTRSNYLNKKKGVDSKEHNNLKLYVSKMESDGEWSDLVNFPYNGDEYSVGHATVTEDGKTMYFTSDMPGGKGQTDIWMSKMFSGKWGKPVNMKDINTEGREMFPFISKTGTLYFSSDGYAGLGGLDVYKAAGTGDGTFGKAENMMFPLNTNYDDFGLIINKEENKGYFSSNRKGIDAVGDDDIYRFEMIVPFKPEFYTVKGCSKNQSNEVIASSTIKLINTETGETVQEMVSDDGCYEFKDLPAGKYKIEGDKVSYEKVSDFPINTDEFKGSDINDADVILKAPDCALIGHVVDAETNAPLSMVIAKFTNKNTGAVKTYVTDETGKFMDPLTGMPCPGASLDYDISFEKEGYFPKRMTYKTTILKPGIVNLDESLNLKMKKAVEGETVNEFCEINPILYDFDKSYIRRDAAVELDKLVKCMNENPSMVIEIGSHTDCRASRRYNERLSARRAKSAKEYVISKGISASRISGRGYGESRLLNGCACEPTNKSSCSEEEHQLNRRTEFKIVSGGNGVKNNSTDSFDK